MWNPVVAINNDILTAKGYSGYFLKSELIKKIAAIIILIATMPFGIGVMCMGLVVYAFCDMFIISSFVQKKLKITIVSQLKALFPIFLLNLFTGFCTFLFSLLIQPVLGKLILSILFACILYLGLSYLFKFKEIWLLKSAFTNRVQSPHC